MKKKYINILCIGEINLQNKIDNLDEQQQAKLAKYISKLGKEKQLAKRLKQLPKKKLTKIVSSTNKAYESFNVDKIKIHKYNCINQKN